MSDEHRAIVIYLVHEQDPDWDGTTATSVDADSPGTVALATFTGVWASYFGAPNDEALHGHPLATKGLRPYGAFTVDRSTWKSQLAARNEVHPHHRAELFETFTHYVFTFHDTTFECVARAVTFDVRSGSISEAVSRAAGQLGRA